MADHRTGFYRVPDLVPRVVGYNEALELPEIIVWHPIQNRPITLTRYDRYWPLETMLLLELLYCFGGRVTSTVTTKPPSIYAAEKEGE